MNGTDQKVTPISDEAIESAPMWLKVIVVVLGLAIIAMLGLILYRVLAGPSPDDSLPPAAVGQSSPRALAIVPQDFELLGPAGSKLVALVPSGDELFLHFQVDGADGNASEHVIILNRRTGSVSTVRIAIPKT